MTKTDIAYLIIDRLMTGKGALVAVVAATFICSVLMKIPLDQWQQMVIVSVVSFYFGNQTKDKAIDNSPVLTETK